MAKDLSNIPKYTIRIFWKPILISEGRERVMDLKIRSYFLLNIPAKWKLK
jgi:hypothetical protein